MIPISCSSSNTTTAHERIKLSQAQHPDNAGRPFLSPPKNRHKAHCIAIFPMSSTIGNVRPMFELKGRNFVVTGGAQGIGFAITRAICEMGGNVAVWDIQKEPVSEFNTLGSQFGAKTMYIQTDVSSQESLSAAFETTIREMKTLHGCVPAAGIAIDKPFVDQTWEEYNRIQDINVRLGMIPLYPPHFY